MEETNKKEEYLKERYTLAMERIHGIVREETVPAPFCVYFKKTSEFLIQVEELWTKLRVGETKIIRWNSGRSLITKCTGIFCRSTTM